MELDQHKPTLRVLTRGTETPTPREIDENPRAASARLRAVERINALQSELNRVKGLNLTLTQDLEAARRQLLV